MKPCDEGDDNRRAVSPGEYILEELEARGWELATLAEGMGCPVEVVKDIVSGEGRMTPDLAARLGKALGTSAEVWMGLEMYYRWYLSKQINKAKE